jgi:hypothetical protein
MNKFVTIVAACCLLACRSKYTEDETTSKQYRLIRTEYFDNTSKGPIQITYPVSEQIITFDKMPLAEDNISSFRIEENAKVIYEANYENCNGNITSILIPQLNDMVTSRFRRFVIDGKRAMIIYKKSESEYVLVERSNLGDIPCDELDQHVGQGIQLVGNEPIHFLERLDNEPGF